MTLLGIMQDKPLLISDIIQYAGKYHSTRHIISRDARNGEHRYTYADAASRAQKLARVLMRWKIAPGDRVATIAMNHHRHFELFYGVSGFGAVLHTVNPRLFGEQIVYICNHAEDRVLFFDSQYLPLVLSLSSKLKTIERYVILDPQDDDESVASQLPGFTTFEAALASESDDFEWPSFDERTASSLCYTSGTTGNPKGVLYSHRSTVLHALASCQNSAMGLSCHDTIMPIAPMFHVNAWALPYLAPMVGAKLVLPGMRLDAELLQALIEQEGITFTAAVPTVFVALLEYLERTGKRIDTLKKAVIGGAPVPPAMIDLLREKYGCFVAQLWGMTELSPLGTMTTLTPTVEALPAEQRHHYYHKPGRVQFGLDLKIVDDSGRPLPHDGLSPGALWARGSWAAGGYFKNEGGAVLDRDGWLPTGNVATIDPYGFIRITDRTKDFIKSGGEWISSVELENLAYGCPGVRLAAVIAAKHPKWDERPLMIVVLKNGASTTKREIIEQLQPRVAKWWLPDDVLFIEDMPLTSTGKIRKTVLRDRFANHLLGSDGADSILNPLSDSKPSGTAHPRSHAG
jgi:3-(methylthio)propionyl---CoA ligase